jgi:hypothetical protein
VPDREASTPALNAAALAHIIAESERWLDQVEPYHDHLSDTTKAWLLGFAAAMQRVEIYGRQLIDETRNGRRR